ncbi:MAG: histidine phosphatase family protein [Bacillota bacterium]
MKFIWIRHAQTIWNTQHKTQGRTDTPLDETGLMQAEHLAERLKNSGLNAIYSSPLQRALQTAQPLAKATGVPTTPDERLTEIDFGEWEGLRFDEIAALFPETFEHWRVRPFTAEIPGAERPKEVLARMRDFFEHISAASDDTVAIVSHTLPLKLMIAHLIGLPYDRIHSLRLDNTGTTETEVRSDGMITLVHSNNTSHLLEGMLTWQTLR